MCVCVFVPCFSFLDFFCIKLATLLSRVLVHSVCVIFHLFSIYSCTDGGGGDGGGVGEGEVDIKGEEQAEEVETSGESRFQSMYSSPKPSSSPEEPESPPGAKKTGWMPIKLVAPPKEEESSTASSSESGAFKLSAAADLELGPEALPAGGPVKRDRGAGRFRAGSSFCTPPGLFPVAPLP